MRLFRVVVVTTNTPEEPPYFTFLQTWNVHMARHALIEVETRDIVRVARTNKNGEVYLTY